MAYDDDETGAESSRPREFFKITHGTTVHRIATGQRDISYLGETYTAQAGARTDIQVDPASAQFGVAVVLPDSHPLVQRYTALLTPPQVINVDIWSMQTNGDVAHVWSGFVTSMSTDRDYRVKFLVVKAIEIQMQRKLPAELVDAVCTTQLYSAWCGVDPGAFFFNAVAVIVDGIMVTLSTDGGNPLGWAKFGSLFHPNSGESMSIVDQTSTGGAAKVLTLQAPIYELQDGDTVVVFAGCDKTPDTCLNKFSNMVNYVGLPLRPSQNPWLPTGLGIVESS